MNQGGGAGSRRAWAAGLVLAGTALLSLQGGFLRVAMPVIRRDLDTGIAGIQAVSVAGLLVVIVSLVALGRLTDIAGPRRMYAGGLGTFALGAAMSGASPSTGWLVLAQAVQGAGWSMCVASSPVVLVSSFGPGERGRALAGNHMAVAVGLAAGPAAGGLLIEALGWRAGFAVMAPPAFLLGGLVLARLADPERRAGRLRFDLRGSVVLAGALLGLLLLIERGGRGALDPPALAVLGALTLGGLAGFAVLQVRAEEPLVDLRLFADRRFSAGLAATFLNFIAMASNMFLIPFLLQDLLGKGAASAGLVMMVVPAVILLAAPVAGAMADRTAPRVPATLGLGCVTASVILMAGIRPGASVLQVALVLVLYGVGAGLFQSPNTASVLGAAPSDRVGVASGTLATVARLGQVAGVAVAGGAWQAGLARHGEGAASLALAFRGAFILLAGFGALAMAASWARGGVPATRPGVAARPPAPGVH